MTFSVWLDINTIGIFHCFHYYFVGRTLFRITRFLNFSIISDKKKNTYWELDLFLSSSERLGRLDF